MYKSILSLKKGLLCGADYVKRINELLVAALLHILACMLFGFQCTISIKYTKFTVIARVTAGQEVDAQHPRSCRNTLKFSLGRGGVYVKFHKLFIF